MRARVRSESEELRVKAIVYSTVGNRDVLSLVELRNQGHDWAAIAERVGGNAAALRQKLHRALARLSQEFGLEGDSEE